MKRNMSINKILGNEEQSDSNQNTRLDEYEDRTDLLERGVFKVLLTNKTGAPSVRGSIVSCSTLHDLSFILQTNEFDAIGVVSENGIADGELCYVIVNGIADVLLENGTASVRGNWVHAATTDGRADASLSQPSGGGFENASEHFKEIGHCLESKIAGTNVLAKCIVHFN